MLDGSGVLSFDVLAWLTQQGVALVHIDWKGDVLSVMAPQGYAADRAQGAVASRDPRRQRAAHGVLDGVDHSQAGSIHRDAGRLGAGISPPRCGDREGNART